MPFPGSAVFPPPGTTGMAQPPLGLDVLLSLPWFLLIINSSVVTRLVTLACTVFSFDLGPRGAVQKGNAQCGGVHWEEKRVL